VGERLVRPHDVELLAEPADPAVEAMVSRVVHLGFEVRVELASATDGPISAQLSRAEADALELRAGDVVWVRAPLGAQTPVTG
jgi:sulfate transport system ATP-binding protein